MMAGFEWENGGSYQDLSGMPLAKNSMWPTSQAAGNRQAKPDNAMTAPGSNPVDRELKDSDMADPEVDVGQAIPPATSGKPQASTQAGPVPRSRAAWGKVTVPDVLREKLP
jgi:hypothetical protein